MVNFKHIHSWYFLEKEKNHFEVLPEGWIEVTHSCGMPVYLHRESRVCTVTKPYFIGPASARVRPQMFHF